MTVFSLFPCEAAALAATGFLLYNVGLAVYRLYFHPLANFPGPKLAAATLWVEFYHDVIRSGMYIWEIEKMHKNYGPIVRISPHELHILDPDYFDQIYTGANDPKDKYMWHTKAADCTTAIGFTGPHELHRMRRASIEPFFSKRSVTALEGLMKDKTERLSERVEEYRQKGQPVNLTCAYLAYGTDVITDYAFDDDYRLLDLPNFNSKWKDEILCLMRSLAFISHFPWLPRLLERLPTRVAAALSPDVSTLLSYKARIARQITRVISSKGYQSRRRTIFEEMRDSLELPPAQKEPARLTDEASILVVAAAETPAKVLAIIHYHLLAQPRWGQMIREELKTIMPDSRALPSVNELEKLPILNACIQEGLRLHNGVSTRSQRISHTDMQYKDWTIPAGTPISSIMVFIHYHPDIFPDGRSFKPQRWIDAKTNGTANLLRKHFHPYSRGTRNCMGYNLGNAEMYLILAALFRRFDMELYDTDITDVDLERDWFIPQPRWNSKGVRAKVVSRIE